jgi:hypothetical protein
MVHWYARRRAFAADDLGGLRHKVPVTDQGAARPGGVPLRQIVV